MSHVAIIVFCLLAREGEVRLVGGSGEHEGRVEIYHAGQWGTICDDSWDEEDGNIVCGQLGFGRLVHVTVRASFGEGTGIIWMDEVSCTGREESLAGCDHIGWGMHNCGHGEDAGVVCAVGKDTTLGKFIRSELKGSKIFG